MIWAIFVGERSSGRGVSSIWKDAEREWCFLFDMTGLETDGDIHGKQEWSPPCFEKASLFGKSPDKNKRCIFCEPINPFLETSACAYRTRNFPGDGGVSAHGICSSRGFILLWWLYPGKSRVHTRSVHHRYTFSSTEIILFLLRIAGVIWGLKLTACM